MSSPFTRGETRRRGGRQAQVPLFWGIRFFSRPPSRRWGRKPFGSKKSSFRMTRISTAAATAGRAHNHSFDPGPISGRQKRRLRLILTVVLIGFAGVIGRLLYLHCINREFLMSKAEKQRSIVVPIPSRRGDILDRHNRKLASTVDAKSLHAFPSRVDNPHKVADTLAPPLGCSSKRLLKCLTSGSGFVVSVGRVDAICFGPHPASSAAAPASLSSSRRVKGNRTSGTACRSGMERYSE